MTYEHIIAFDLETTGWTAKRDHIIEIGLVHLDVATGERQEASVLFDPGVAIPSHISEMTGIDRAVMDEEGVGDLATVIDVLRAFAAMPSVLFVGHNSKQFDAPFLERAGLRINPHRHWDTLLEMRADILGLRGSTHNARQRQAAKRRCRDKTTLDAAVVKYVARRKRHGKRHRALPDACRTLDVYLSQRRRLMSRSVAFVAKP